MSTATDIDLELLVGEMEAVPCDSLGHGFQSHVHDSGPATHYARVSCQACGANVIKAYCSGFVQFVLKGGGTICAHCGDLDWLREAITILGPVGGRK